MDFIKLTLEWDSTIRQIWVAKTRITSLALLKNSQLTRVYLEDGSHVDVTESPDDIIKMVEGNQ